MSTVFAKDTLLQTSFIFKQSTFISHCWFFFFFCFDNRPTILMMLTCIHSKRLFFLFFFFLQWGASILCLSIILKSCTLEKSFIFVHRSPFVNIALWLFRQHDKLYVPKFVSLSLSLFYPHLPFVVPSSYSFRLYYSIYTLSSSCFTLFFSRAFSRSVSLSLFLMSSYAVTRAKWEATDSSPAHTDTGLSAAVV